jgi:hypothetical protein
MASEQPPGILRPGQIFDSHIGNTVINLSDKNLTEPQVLILRKGLTFCPTPNQPDLSEIWLDFKDFHRRIELQQFFIENPIEDTNSDRSPFIPKSKWRPPICNKTLEAYKNA